MQPTSPDKPWYMATAKEACALLDVTTSKGLSTEQLKVRKNTKLKKATKVRTPKFGVSFWSLQVIAIVASAGFLLLTNSVWFSIFTITALIFILFGLAQQNYVEHIVDKLVKTPEFNIHVRRDGKKQIIKANELAIGDIVLIAPGDYIPADMRIIELKELLVDQHELTGEALPAIKNSFAIYKKTKQIDQKNMLFAGSFAVAGTAVAVVVSLPDLPQHHSGVAITKSRLNKAQKSRLLTIALSSSLLGALLLIVSNNFVAIALLMVILVVSTYKYMDYWLHFTVWATLYEELYQKGIYFSNIPELQKTFKADTVLLRVNADTMEQAAFVHQLQAELLVEVRPLVDKKQVKELEEELNINDAALTAKKFLGLRRDKKLAHLREYQLLVGFDDVAVAESISLLMQAGHHVLWVDDNLIPGVESTIASEYIALHTQPSAMALVRSSAKFNQPSLRKIAIFFAASKKFKKITAY